MDARRMYTPSHRVELGDFWPRLLLLYALAGLLATVYALLTRYEIYTVGWVWLFPLGTKLWLTRITIRESHCRHPLFAAAAIATVGVLIQLGTYHIDRCSRWGVE